MKPGSIVVALCAGALAAAAALPARGLAQDDVARRVADRLAALRQEADELSKQGATVLGELRKLELDRQIRTEELAAIERDLAGTRQRLAETAARAGDLRRTAEERQPDIDERVVRLYKMGRAGYWRLLLDVDDLRAVGRAYRTAAALTRLDRERVQAHRATLDAVARETAELEAREAELDALQAKALGARAALDRAVTARAGLVTSIEGRRDLAAQLAAELDAAHLRLQASLAQRSDPAAAVTLPLRPFRGVLPWPARGIVISRFGRERAARVPGIEFSRNGIEISLAEGQPVASVHEGTVSHAGPFGGLGQLVIVDHGGGAASLYGHLGSVGVNKGERVAAGTSVGTSGRNTGGNPSLYFELRVDGKPVDPLQWLKRP